MPLTAIVVSKDRAAQLDLLLRSVTCHAEGMIDNISVIWDSSDTDMEQAYSICESEHPSVDFYQEDNFLTDVIWQIEHAAEHVMFLTDDSWFYREAPEVDPCSVLSGESGVLCFSLRLGDNTNTCYPLRGRWQNPPLFDDGGGYLVWEWAKGDADFGYPGSLDGHIFRRRDLINMLRGEEKWWNPNTLEDVLSRAVYRSLRGYMACFGRSILVGVPVNRTSTSHPGNRYAKTYFIDYEWLNNRFLEGRRIKFPDVHPDTIHAAHQEMNLEVL
jgi:hypothetical protein